MSKRAESRTPTQQAGPPAAPRISGISYTLAPDHAFTTQATYRYGTHTHPAQIRLDPHRYDLMCALVAQLETSGAGAEEVAMLLHEVYYCLYAPRPAAPAPRMQTGRVPDRS